MSAATSDVWPNLSKKLGVEVAARDTSQAPRSRIADMSEGLFNPCSDGERTDALLRIAGSMLGRGFDLNATTSFCRIWNSKNTPPLPDAKVVTTCRSIADKDTREHPERRPHGIDLLEPITEQLEPLFDLQSASVEKFLTTPAPSRRWILEDVLPLGIVAAIISPGGSGKSQFLMQLAYAVSSGTELAGHWKVGEPGSVLMLCAEDDRDEIHRRIHRIHEHLSNQADEGRIRTVVDRLFVRSMVGEEVLMTEIARNNEAVRTTFVERLCLTAGQTIDLKLIIIDPGARFRGGDENSNQHATRFVQALEALSQQTGATVFIAHHANKAGTFGNSEPNQNASRGASALTDAVRLQFSLTPVPKATRRAIGSPPDAQNSNLLLSIVKSNYTARTAAVQLRRGGDGYLTATTGTVALPYADRMVQIKLLQLIARTKKPLTARHIEDHFCGEGKEIFISQKNMRAVIETARNSGFIEGEKGRPLVLTTAGEESLGY